MRTFIVGISWVVLFHENEIDCTNDEQEGQNVIPVQVSALKQDVGDDGKDAQRYTFLDDLQLYKIERTAVALEADAVGRNLTTILKESNHPRKSNDANQWPVVADARLL